MTSPAELLRRHLTLAENALVPEADVDAALRRATAGRTARTRVEVAALLVYRGSLSSRVPTLESRPLRLPLVARLLGARSGALPKHPTMLHPRALCVPVHPLPRAA